MAVNSVPRWSMAVLMLATGLALFAPHQAARSESSNPSVGTLPGQGPKKVAPAPGDMEDLTVSPAERRRRKREAAAAPRPTALIYDKFEPGYNGTGVHQVKVSFPHGFLGETSTHGSAVVDVFFSGYTGRGHITAIGFGADLMDFGVDAPRHPLLGALLQRRESATRAEVQKAIDQATEDILPEYVIAQLEEIVKKSASGGAPVVNFSFGLSPWRSNLRHALASWAVQSFPRYSSDPDPDAGYSFATLRGEVTTEVWQKQHTTALSSIPRIARAFASHPNILFIVAAGNETLPLVVAPDFELPFEEVHRITKYSHGLLDPGKYMEMAEPEVPNMIVVAALENKDRNPLEELASYSSYGEPITTSVDGRGVDPKSGVLSSERGQGTSFAAPRIAAFWAMAMRDVPSLTPQVAKVITQYSSVAHTRFERIKFEGRFSAPLANHLVRKWAAKRDPQKSLEAQLSVWRSQYWADNPPKLPLRSEGLRYYSIAPIGFN